jgi:glycosyltransferase involved in cell wall biosynthesis
LYWIKLAVELIKYNEDHSFIFIGDGPERKELEHKIKQLNISNVYFLGSMSKTEVVPWFKSSYAALFSTTNHPVQQTCSPNKLFDSFAAGVPVVQTSTGWISELIENEKCGINLDLCDVNKSALLLSDFLNNSHSHKKFSLNSKKLAIKNYDKNILANKYMSIFNK